MAVAALVGCGGGGGSVAPPASPPITGKFVGGPVQGLRYRTATQSGLTNAASEFSYVPGETVTFSIGGVQLGTAAGAPEISLFSLVGIEPPRTEVDLRSELITPNDVTGFDRVANRARLLLALDNDRDASNGIDLTGWDTRLANATLSFERSLYCFAVATSCVQQGSPFKEFQAFAVRFGLNRDVPIHLPLVQLYRALGIPVVAQARVAESEDSNNDGIVDRIRKVEYDAQGRENFSASDGDADGIDEQFTRSTFRSDSQLESQRRTEDNNDDGVTDILTDVSFEYDASGRLVSRISERVPAVGTGTRASERFTYDAAGNVLTSVDESDLNDDGSIEQRKTTTSTFDSENNELTRVELVEAFGGRGRTVETSTYDARGNLLTRLRENDLNADDVIESRRQLTQTHDALGNLVTLLEVNESAAGSRSVTTASFVYDAAGRTISLQSEGSQNGVVNARQEATFTYDDRGNLVDSIVEATFGSGPGIRVEQEFTYGPAGNFLRFLAERDGDEDGVIDQRTEAELTYSASLQPLERILRVDQDADGGFENSESVATSYRELGDALEALIRQYAADPLTGSL